MLDRRCLEVLGEGKKFQRFKKIIMKNLSPVTISLLPFGKGCRYGVADRLTGKLVHSSDSKAWILGQIKRMENVRYQFVMKL